MTTPDQGQVTPASTTPETPTPANTATPAGAPAPTDEAPAREPDVDDIAIVQLRKDLEAEKTGTPAPAETLVPPAAGATPTGQPAAAAPTDDAGKKQPVMIPKDRLDEVLSREQQTAVERDEAIAAAAYWKAHADLNAKGGGTPAGTPTGQPPANTPTPAQQIGALEKQITDLAEKFDNGDITLKAFKAEELKLGNRIQSIRERAILASVPKPQAAAPQADMRLDELTADLEAKHPYVAELSAPEFEQKWLFMSREAAANLGADWAAMPDGPRKNLMLRQETARLSDTYGPIWTGKQLQPAKQPGTTPAQQPAGLTPAANQRLQKLTMAGNAPPDSTKIGQASTPAAQVSDAQVMQMTDEEIMALPPAERLRILPSLQSG
jgi:Transcription termination and cleavage factor C-terminal